MFDFIEIGDDVRPDQIEIGPEKFEETLEIAIDPLYPDELRQDKLHQTITQWEKQSDGREIRDESDGHRQQDRFLILGINMSTSCDARAQGD